jgi:hypothetical protein
MARTRQLLNWTEATGCSSRPAKPFAIKTPRFGRLHLEALENTKQHRRMTENIYAQGEFSTRRRTYVRYAEYQRKESVESRDPVSWAWKDLLCPCLRLRVKRIIVLAKNLWIL